jgi:hypothetical protein
MQRWLIIALLNRVFGRASEQVLANTRRIIDENNSQDDFPFDILNAELTRMRLPVRWDGDSLQRFLSTTWPSAFLQLSLLYDDYLWGLRPTSRTISSRGRCSPHIILYSAAYLQTSKRDT